MEGREGREVRGVCREEQKETWIGRRQRKKGKKERKRGGRKGRRVWPLPTAIPGFILAVVRAGDVVGVSVGGMVAPLQ